jgi:ABC-type Fe3+/spermidine/putrescine transport system ATPase subunit
VVLFRDQRVSPEQHVAFARRLRTELKDLQRRTGITFVDVTHDRAETLAPSDRIAGFHAGVLRQYGPPREVYERPANLYVADVMGLVNKLSGEIVGEADGGSVFACRAASCSRPCPRPAARPPRVAIAECRAMRGGGTWRHRTAEERV